MHTRTSLALLALRGTRWGAAVACGAAAAPFALAAGGTAIAVPAVTAVTVATAVAGAMRGPGHAAGLAGIARAWARAHPWRFAAGPAAGLTAALLTLDAVTGWPPGGAALAGLAVLAAPRAAVLRPPRTARPVRATTPLTDRRLARALPAPAPRRPIPSRPWPEQAERPARTTTLRA